MAFRERSCSQFTHPNIAQHPITQLLSFEYGLVWLMLYYAMPRGGISHKTGQQGLKTRRGSSNPEWVYQYHIKKKRCPKNRLKSLGPKNKSSYEETNCITSKGRCGPKLDLSLGLESRLLVAPLPGGKFHPMKLEPVAQIEMALMI